uniref:Uncharacterized protein n=1 Tax=Parascaris univalens TaxID=6257 RepID=A0A915ARK6_PARUN
MNIRRFVAQQNQGGDYLAAEEELQSISTASAADSVVCVKSTVVASCYTLSSVCTVNPNDGTYLAYRVVGGRRHKNEAFRTSTFAFIYLRKAKCEVTIKIGVPRCIDYFRSEH